MAGGGEKSVPETEVKVGESGDTASSGGPAVDAQQNQVGNAAVIDMLNDKKLAEGVSTLQMAAEEEMGKRAETLAQGSPGQKSQYPMTINLRGIWSEGYAYWRGESRPEPAWNLTFEALPDLTHMGADEGYVVSTQEIYANTQATIMFEGDTFEDFGIASYRYTGGFDVWPGMGAVPSGGGWGLVGTM